MLHVKEKEEKKWKNWYLICQSHENNKSLKQFIKKRPGRPALKDLYLDLHKAIVAIATAGAGADSRWGTENLNACLILDNLWDSLIKDGYELSRSALSLRFLPRPWDREEGKRHTKTDPVKIRNAKNNLRKKHADANFKFATKDYLKNILSIFGLNFVLVLSIDDKAKVSIEMTAATKLASMVMHMTYEIRLPDHDFVVATSY